MSLNWNCKPMTERGIDIYCDRDATGEREYLNPVTEALVWATMIVGCDGRKIDTFTQRIRECESACGALVHQPRPEYLEKAIACNTVRADSFTTDGYISKAELQRHEGFTTNASSLTDAQWAKKLATIVREYAQSSLRRELARG
jgi:hypothetical protein